MPDLSRTRGVVDQSIIQRATENMVRARAELDRARASGILPRIITAERALQEAEARLTRAQTATDTNIDEG